MDIELVRELFENCARAADELGVDAGFRTELRRTAERLPPLQVGARGQLQEWIEDYPEAEPAHRHVSHLYSLFPGHSISLERTPPLAAAARKSLELRGDGGTGGRRPGRSVSGRDLATRASRTTNLKSLMTRSTLPNMFDLHPPFQIDGNLGGPPGSRRCWSRAADEIRLLPALPRQWPGGSLKGVRVRGGGAGPTSRGRTAGSRNSGFEPARRRPTPWPMVSGRRRSASGRARRSFWMARWAGSTHERRRPATRVGKEEMTTKNLITGITLAVVVGLGSASRRRRRRTCRRRFRAPSPLPSNASRSTEPRWKGISRATPSTATPWYSCPRAMPGRRHGVTRWSTRCTATPSAPSSGPGRSTSADDRGRVCPRRQGGHCRPAGLEDRSQRVDVLEFGHHGRLRTVHRA